MPHKISSELLSEVFKLVWTDCDRERLRERAEARASVDTSMADDDAPLRKISGIKDDAAAASAELVRLFVAELIHRAAAVAKAEGDDVVDGTHLERVLPQMLLDYGS